MLEKIILDTNFLLVPIQFRVDIFSEFLRIVPHFKLFFLSRSLDELARLDNGRYKELCEKMISVKEIEIIKTYEDIDVDDILLKKAKKGYVIATNDRELRERLSKERLNHIFMRQKNKLEWKQFNKFH